MQIIFKITIHVMINSFKAKDQLRLGLSSLPAPKNDYEIVVPEEELNEEETSASMNDVVEDQADIDARKQQELREQGNF